MDLVVLWILWDVYLVERIERQDPELGYCGVGSGHTSKDVCVGNLLIEEFFSKHSSVYRFNLSMPDTCNSRPVYGKIIILCRLRRCFAKFVFDARA